MSTQTDEPDKLLSSDCPLRFLARVTLELETPMHIGTGQEWDESDAGVALDANGLPTVPLTGLIGMLREAFEKRTDKKATNSLFGWQGNTDDGKGIGQGSRLRGSFGCIHDASDTPVYGLVPPNRFKLTKELADKLPKRRENGSGITFSEGDVDPVLAAALRPTLRDHARHNQYGAIASEQEKGGKFDELVVCAGHRFTFELELIARASDHPHWDDLFSLVANSLTRLGGKSRRGFGRFKVVRVLRRTFDLRNGNFEDYANYDSRLDKPIPASGIQPGKWELFTPAVVQPPTITVTLKPRFFWMFGAGQDLDGDSDRAPVRDQRIVWINDVPDVRKDVLYLPGSGFKGALRHRAWFHAQAKFKHFTDQPNEPGRVKAKGLVTELFGNEPDAGSDELQPGILHPDDQFELIDAAVAELQNHNSIDRFTAGARDALLFDEKPLWRSGGNKRVARDTQPGLRFSVQLRRKLKSNEAGVLGKCLNDLTQSRLAIGGGSGRGNGFCDGNYTSQCNGSTQTPGLAAVTEATTTTDAP